MNIIRKWPASLSPRLLVSLSIPLLLPAAFFVLIAKFGLQQNAFEYDPDEGLNLMKALLVGHGHRLYTEIWNDQPPMLTMLLAAVFRWTGPTVEAGRLTVLAMSSLLLLALFQTLRQLEGWLAGVLAIALLAGMQSYMRLSFSVMIGLPAVALAMLSVWLAVEHRRCGDGTRLQRWVWWALTVLSGMLMGLSLMTKLFTITLAILPLAAILLPMPAERGFARLNVRRQLVAGLVWLGAAGATFGLIALALHVNYRQVITTHALARGKSIPGDPNFLRHLNDLWIQQPLLFTAAGAFLLLMAIPDRWRPIWRWSRGIAVLAAALGLLILFLASPSSYNNLLTGLEREMWRWHHAAPWLTWTLAGLSAAAAIWFRPARALPIAAIAISGWSLHTHYPVWGHQMILVILPLCWIAGAAMAGPVEDLHEATAAIRFPRCPPLVVRCVGAMLPLIAGATFCWWWTTHTILPTRQLALGGGNGSDSALVAAIKHNAARTRFMYSDRPIYPFRAGVLVMPSMVVNSEKRRLTDNLTDQQILAELRRLQPEQVHLSRFRYSGEVRSYLDRNYIWRGYLDGGQLYVAEPLERPPGFAFRRRR